MALENFGVSSQTRIDMIKNPIAKKPRLRGHILNMSIALFSISGMAWSYGEIGYCNFSTKNIDKRVLKFLKDYTPDICNFKDNYCTVHWSLPYIPSEKLNTNILTEPDNQLDINIKKFEGLKWTDDNNQISKIWPHHTYSSWAPTFNTATGSIESFRIKTIKVIFSPFAKEDSIENIYLELKNPVEPRDFPIKEKWQLIIFGGPKGETIYNKLIDCNVTEASKS